LLVSRDALAAKLALPDHMRCFNAVDSGLGGMEGLEAHHGAGDLFDKSVVLLDDVVQVLHLQYFDKPDPARNQQQEVDVFESRIVGATLVHDHLVREPVSIDGTFEKGRSSGFVTVFGQHEVQGVAELVDGPVEVDTLALDLDVSLVVRHEGAPGRLRFLAFSVMRGEYSTTQWLSVAWSTSTPRSAMMSSRSR